MDEELRLKLLRLLTEKPTVTQREVAQALGISLGKANFCVRALIEKGWIKVENFKRNPNKLGYAYVLTPNGLRAKARATLSFLKRKQDEYAELEREIAQLRAEAASHGGARTKIADLLALPGVEDVEIEINRDKSIVPPARFD